MNKIILIDHHDNPRDDRAAEYLKESGFELDLRCPFKGDPLPPVQEEIKGVVIYGGSMNVTEVETHPYLADEMEWIETCLRADTKILGICLGAQLLAHTLGARVGAREDNRCEFGYYEINPTEAGKGWIPDRFLVTQAHFQEFDIPEGAVHLAYGEHFKNQAFRYTESAIGLQFHPEVSARIFRRWQNAEWAFFDSFGAQTRTRQEQLIDKADPIQGDWFRGLLTDLFGSTQNDSTDAYLERNPGNKVQTG